MGISVSGLGPSPLIASSTGGTKLLEQLSESVEKGTPINGRVYEQITANDLKAALSAYFDKVVSNLGEKDPWVIIEKLAKMIPYEALEQTVYQEKGAGSKKIEEMLCQAQYYLENCEYKGPQRSWFEGLREQLLLLLESIFSVIGLEEFFTFSENNWDSDRKAHKLFTIVGVFGFFTSFEVSDVAKKIIGYSILLVALASLFYSYLKPVPPFISCTENWTRKFQRGEMEELAFTGERREVLNSIAAALIKGKHPILLGETGVGKTHAIKVFIEAIERGDYPELKGKKVFYVNTSELFKPGNIFSDDPLKKIRESVRKNRKKIILVFDEFHVVCQKNLSEQLKSAFDPGGDFPFAIGITTKKEYDECISGNEALVRRLEPVIVDSATKEVTEEILNRTLLLQKEGIICERGVISAIVRETEKKKWVQPSSSRQVLEKCVELASPRLSSNNSQIERLKSEVEVLKSRDAASLVDLTAERDLRGEISDLLEQIGSLTAKLKKEGEDFNTLDRARHLIPTVKKRMYETVIAAQKSSFILISSFLAPSLERVIRGKAGKLQVNVVIDRLIVDQAVKIIGDRKQALQARDSKD